jgi:hypothetical protein
MCPKPLQEQSFASLSSSFFCTHFDHRVWGWFVIKSPVSSFSDQDQDKWHNPGLLLLLLSLLFPLCMPCPLHLVAHITNSGQGTGRRAAWWLYCLVLSLSRIAQNATGFILLQLMVYVCAYVSSIEIREMIRILSV